MQQVKVKYVNIFPTTAQLSTAQHSAVCEGELLAHVRASGCQWLCGGQE